MFEEQKIIVQENIAPFLTSQNTPTERIVPSLRKFLNVNKPNGSNLVLATAEPQMKRKERLIMSTPPREVAETIEKEVRTQQESESPLTPELKKFSEDLTEKIIMELKRTMERDRVGT